MANPNPDLTGLTDREVPGLMTGTWPLKLRSFVARRLELLFVILILGMVLTVFFLIPYKIAFLNLFYLPVLTAAYFIGKRKAVLGAVLCILLVLFLGIQFPEWFSLPASRFNTLMRIVTWGSFLILTSAAVGSLQERLAKGFEETRQLYEELKRSRVMEEMKEKVEKTLYSTMDPIVAKLATEGKLRFEKRDISIMFTDLTNFTRYSDQNRPDVVVDELNAYLKQMEPITELFRGHIDKYMGDGMMIEFGAPVDYDRHALLAILAGWKMQQKVAQLSLPWRMRIGIASGSAIVGMMGAKRQSYTALGDRVNLAKRLEEICPPGKVCVDEFTYQAVKPFFLATKLRSGAYGRQGDPELLEKLESLEDRLAKEGESPQLLFELGTVSSKLNDASAALRYLKRAMSLDPESTEIKLAFADANIQKDEIEKVKIKGKLEKVTVYEITMMKDRWNDLMVIPAALAAKYQGIEKILEVPEEVVIGVEALDGSVGNARVVALLSYALADHMNLNEDLKRSILLAGYLQDIGKEAVPHHILNRSGSLTEQETKLVEKYVQESVASMKRLGYVDPKVTEIVAHHHEAWSGAGYPDHLAGEAIPVGARITAVAEAYSALTAWRPYREAWDARVAISELRKGVEKGRYDPKVVVGLEELLKSHE
jgi:HD-GYP domain-containing protein (c-di-GMP phosphodiesterase class II)/class 3 adenylate cyclase